MALGAAATALTPVPSGPASATDDPPRSRPAAAPAGAPPQTAPPPPSVPPPTSAAPPTSTATDKPATLLSAPKPPQATVPKQDAPAQDAPAQDALAQGALPDLPDSLRLEHAFAELVLRANGIRWRSTGGCSDRTIRTCTSFEGVRWGTLKGLIGFARSSGCTITVTGGTEVGHAGGTYSHANGYKLDISPTRCVDAAIKRYPYAGRRGDGSRLYRSPDGALFAREKDHWDITFR